MLSIALVEVTVRTKHRGGRPNKGVHPVGTPYLVARVDEIPPGADLVVKLGDKEILLVNLDGTIYAVGNRCTHVGLSMEGAFHMDSEIICPWHGARFDARTGAALSLPAREPLTSYPVSIINDMVAIGVACSGMGEG